MKGNEQIVVEYALPAPPQQVWRTLTEPNLLAIWLMASDIVPLVGHKFKFRSEPRGDWNGIVDCQVLEVDPDARLAYTWNGGRWHVAQTGSSRLSSGRWSLCDAEPWVEIEGPGHRKGSGRNLRNGARRAVARGWPLNFAVPGPVQVSR